ncbi:hypothetical protein ACJRO7_020605 [Eucalyptus globulus]|uniref:TF-B3 domain-containing protein n=1 Tax=Eucalyptus globulus TaxID=34317 RepID=A0ABD3KQ02_EUCGL
MTGSRSNPPLHSWLGSSCSSSPIQNANMSTPQGSELPVIDLKGKKSSGSAALNKNERPVPGVSMQLVLYENPWKIRKKLTGSDCGHSSRLLLPLRCVTTHVLQWMSQEMVSRVKSRDGMEVVVRDADRGGEHRLVLHYWASSGSYVLNGDWTKQFVKGRGLGSGTRSGCSGTRSLASSTLRSFARLLVAPAAWWLEFSLESFWLRISFSLFYFFVF